MTNEEGRFERRLPWRAAAKRIAYLIEMQRFLTPQELEQYPAWAAEQQEAASAVRDEPSTIPESMPICAEGSVVYLEDVASEMTLGEAIVRGILPRKLPRYFQA